MIRFWVWLCGLALVAGCGRYFGGPIEPTPEQQGPSMVVKDDGSVIYEYHRLEIGLRPMSDEELNRQFMSYSQRGPQSTNPYTYGNWRPLGEDWTPPKYTVFQLKVKNYAYPKMRVDPSRMKLISEVSRRAYDSLELLELLEYYYAHVQGYTGNAYGRFQDREDILISTLYKNEMVFSGQIADGYVVFPKLDPDVKEFSVHVKDIALRFDYRGEAVETLDLEFRFQREVYRGYQPPASLVSEAR